MHQVTPATLDGTAKPATRAIQPRGAPSITSDPRTGGRDVVSLVRSPLAWRPEPAAGATARAGAGGPAGRAVKPAAGAAGAGGAGGPAARPPGGGVARLPGRLPGGGRGPPARPPRPATPPPRG